MKTVSELGDLKEIGKKIEQLLAENFCKGQKPSIAMAFCLPPDYKTVHWVTNVARQDGINLFKDTAEKMILQTN